MTSQEDIEFQRVVMEGLVPQMEESAFCVSLSPDIDDRIDAKFCVELGAMITLDKPIITVIHPGRTISNKMRLVSDLVIEADLTTPEGQVILAKAMEEFVAKHRDES